MNEEKFESILKKSKSDFLDSWKGSEELFQKVATDRPAGVLWRFRYSLSVVTAVIVLTVLLVPFKGVDQEEADLYTLYTDSLTWENGEEESDEMDEYVQIYENLII